MKESTREQQHVALAFAINQCTYSDLQQRPGRDNRKAGLSNPIVGRRCFQTRRLAKLSEDQVVVLGVPGVPQRRLPRAVGPPGPQDAVRAPLRRPGPGSETSEAGHTTCSCKVSRLDRALQAARKTAGQGTGGGPRPLPSTQRVATSRRPRAPRDILGRRYLTQLSGGHE